MSCGVGKTCINTIGSYFCSCRAGFTGPDCQTSECYNFKCYYVIKLRISRFKISGNLTQFVLSCESKLWVFNRDECGFANRAY